MGRTMEQATSEERNGSASPPDPSHLIPEPTSSSAVEAVDQAVVITRARAWIGLSACLVLLAGVVIWAAVASVGKTITAPGVVLVNGSVVGVPSPVSGTVQNLYVAPGDAVSANQTIGTVRDPAGHVRDLLAAVQGTVLSLPDVVGSTVHQGQEVGTLAQGSGPLKVRMFVSPAQAEQIGPGTRAILSIPGQPTIRGRVADEGNLPLTPAQAADAIGSPALASSLVKGGGVISVIVTPDPADIRRNGAKFDSGDVGTVALIIGAQHPIDYLF